MLNTTKLPPPQPGRKFKDFITLFVFAGLITISFLALLWFLGIISSSLFFDAKDFSLEFVENVIHGGALLAVLIMFFAIGNCLVVAFRYWRGKK